MENKQVIRKLSFVSFVTKAIDCRGTIEVLEVDNLCIN